MKRKRDDEQSTAECRPESVTAFALDYRHAQLGRSLVIHADCFEWLGRIPEDSLHAIITDPPYSVKEYDFDQIEFRFWGIARQVSDRDAHYASHF